MGFWEGKDVLVTGADGFLGSNITEKLVKEKAAVSVITRASSSGELLNISHLQQKITCFKGNIMDPIFLQNSLQTLKKSLSGPLYVMHLAAQSLVGGSWVRPIETIYVNEIGTVNLINSFLNQHIDVAKFSFAGTSEEFGHPHPDMLAHYKKRDGCYIFDEKSPLNPKSPYAISKVAGEFLCLAYHDAYCFPSVITRNFNIFGPKQMPRNVTPTIITQALKRKNVELMTFDTTRDFTYVDDSARAHLLACENGKPGEVYCFGFGNDISICDWAQKIIEIGAKEGHWKNDRQVSLCKKSTHEQKCRPGKTDLPRLSVDYSKALKELGWKPEVTREEGLKRTIKWYAENEHRWAGGIDWL